MSLPEILRADESFRDDVITGLSGDRKSLPSKYFYDAEGSRLFEAICDLPEYYLTRTEIALLSETAPRIAQRIPVSAALVEFGSGASIKTRLLLDAAPQIGLYIPIDISPTALSQAVMRINDGYPALKTTPVVADFTLPLHLPEAARGHPPVGFFPGSTIGNFTPSEATALLRRAKTMLGDDARFLLGADLVKAPDLLLPAYDDSQGVTAAFNGNLLRRINRELGADFDYDAFRHKAVWNAAESRIEMHLVSERDQFVRIGWYGIQFAEGETIHTENSYKFTPAMLSDIAGRAGWQIEASWISETHPFGLFLLKG